MSYAQVGIGTTNPSAASMLEVSGTTNGGATYKGFLPPRVPTVTDRNTINPTVSDIGLLIFLQSTNCLQMWNGSAWEDVHCLGAPTNSSIEFTGISQTVDEGDGGISFDFTITNPSPTNAINVTITPANFDDIDETTATILTIPANVTTHTATNVFTLTDDVLDEGTETLDFTLSAPTGGSGTIMLGTNTVQTVTINDNDAATLTIWINEFHYNNDGTDSGEFIEIAGVAGTDIAGYYIVTYNGGSGATYGSTNTFLGTLTDDNGNGFGFARISFPTNGLQNGDPDGFALIDDTGAVIQFLSYGGTFTATNGPASGLSSEDVGIIQTGDSVLDPVGASLQLIGTGSTYSDFTWSRTTMNTAGIENTGQTIN
ncbi:hypothetical protein [uncultured Dokdonia sp.]|uniref:hypothetical protein n=1 Tax=uncultured Dokdonia sp. TaxID=575653 RepID=UPI0026344624|nr:hypothetical protein [uncultured Dokdonia sp.]